MYHTGSARVDHYNTSHASHYTDRRVPLVVPPGKGGVDMSKSNVPLGRDYVPPEESHTTSMFRGTQIPPHARARECPSRGTLGARLLN